MKLTWDLFTFRFSLNPTVFYNLFGGWYHSIYADFWSPHKNLNLNCIKFTPIEKFQLLIFTTRVFFSVPFGSLEHPQKRDFTKPTIQKAISIKIYTSGLRSLKEYKMLLLILLIPQVECWWGLSTDVCVLTLVKDSSLLLSLAMDAAITRLAQDGFPLSIDVSF